MALHHQALSCILPQKYKSTAGQKYWNRAAPSKAKWCHSIVGYHTMPSLPPDSAHCSNGSYRTFYAGKFSIYEISIYSIHETLRDCLRYTWVKALHSNFFPSVQQELSPKPVAPRQWNNLYPPQFYQTNILTRFDGRGGTGLETAGLWSLVLFILFRRYWRLNYYFFSSFSFHIVSAIEWCSNSNKLVRLIENFSFHPWLSHGFLASLS